MLLINVGREGEYELWHLVSEHLLFPDRCAAAPDVEKDQQFLFVLEFCFSPSSPSIPSVTAPRCWPLTFRPTACFLSLTVAGRAVTDSSPLYPRRPFRDLGFVLTHPSLGESYEGSLSCGITDLIIVKTCKPTSVLIKLGDNLGCGKGDLASSPHPRRWDPSSWEKGGRLLEKHACKEMEASSGGRVDLSELGHIYVVDADQTGGETMSARACCSTYAGRGIVRPTGQ